MAFKWTCPHCGSLQTVVDGKRDVDKIRINVGGSSEGSLSIVYEAIGCSNYECNRMSVSTWLQKNTGNPNYTLIKEGIFGNVLSMRPRASVKPQPEFIPAPLREDYVEACLIRSDSPKAAATLVRRCLQGMIRDFCKITKARLVDEIDALRLAVVEGRAPDGVTLDSVDAIDAVRGIGNIGAHMEKDINMIVDVEPGEAQMLIELVEMLFDEWYVTRHKRQERLAGIAALAAAKKEELAAQKEAAKFSLEPPHLTDQSKPEGD